MVEATLGGAPALQHHVPLRGFAQCFRKELREWLRSRRLLILSALSLLFTALCVGAPFMLVAAEPAAPQPNPEMLTGALLAIIHNPLAWFLVVFSCAGLLVHERVTGTLAWNLTKPLTRTALLLAKWLAASLLVWLTLVAVPLVLATAVGAPLYGGLPVRIGFLALASLLTFVFFAFLALLTLTVSVSVSSQGAIIGAGLAGLFAPGLMALVVPVKVAPWIERLWPVKPISLTPAWQFDLPALGVLLASFIGLMTWGCVTFRRQEIA